MKFWNNLKQSMQRTIKTFNIRGIAKSPVTQIIAINTGMFVLWRITGISESSLIKHFSFERNNIKDNRYYTLITYAFSHFGFISYMFNMIMIGSFGRALQTQFNGKIVWLLYILGASLGGIFMHFGMPNVPLIIPQVGADAAITSMITFYGLFNMHQTVMLFFIPVRMWVLLGLLGLYCMNDPSRKSLGGAIAGLIVYQLFKTKII